MQPRVTTMTPRRSPRTAQDDCPGASPCSQLPISSTFLPDWEQTANHRLTSAKLAMRSSRPPAHTPTGAGGSLRFAPVGHDGGHLASRPSLRCVCYCKLRFADGGEERSGLADASLRGRTGAEWLKRHEGEPIYRQPRTPFSASACARSRPLCLCARTTRPIACRGHRA